MQQTQKIKKLLALLDEIIALLNQYEMDWADFMQQAQAAVMMSGKDGVWRVLSGYGGMGSFNDFVLNDAEGKYDIAANQRLDNLRGVIRDLAQSIQDGDEYSH